MEKESSEMPTKKPTSLETVETTKSSTTINFSVDRILNSCVKKADAESDQKSFEKAISSQKSNFTEDCSRLYRPMPMRYISNSSLYQGNKFSSKSESSSEKRYIGPLHQNHHHFNGMYIVLYKLCISVCLTHKPIGFRVNNHLT